MQNPSDRKPPSRKRQHAVPKFYLDRFSDAGYVSAYDKIAGQRHDRISTKNVTVESNFYTLENVAREDVYFFEEYLAALETTTSETIREVVRHRTVAFGDHKSRLSIKKIMSLFIRFQILRSRSFRNHLVQTGNEYVRDRGIFDLLEMGPPPWLKEGRKYYDALHSYLSDQERFDADNDTVLAVLFGIGSTLASRLENDFRWILVNNGNCSNVTSDFPIGFLSLDNRDGDLWELGVDNIANIWLPLDPEYALLLTKARTAQTEYLIGDPKKLERWNDILKRHAHRWVIWRGNSAAGLIDI